MKDYIVDPHTGFLTPSPALVGPGLNAEQKKMFLTKYSVSFNVTKAAKLAQTDRATVMLHLREDKAFKAAFEAAQDEVLDEVEASLYHQSQKSPIAAMQLLKARRGNEWGKPKKGEEDDTSNKLKALLDKDE